MNDARLITIPLSHYCEKARWVLDATGLPYREEGHPPVAHRRATRVVGAKSVPVLVHGDKVITDSSDIARHANELAVPERRLLPSDPAGRARVLTIEDELDETLGIDARLLVYWYNLGDPTRAMTFVKRMMRIDSPIALRIVTPLFRGLIFRMYKVSPKAAAVAEARVRATFTRMGETLVSQGNDGYLVGDRFTLADLTLASLASILLAPPEHPLLARVKDPPAPALAALAADLHAMPAGRHVMRVYREHRSDASGRGGS